MQPAAFVATSSPRRVALLLASAFALGALGSVSCKKIGEVKTLDVAADAHGEPKNPVDVRIAVGLGTIRITPGGGHAVGGSVKTNASALEPKVETYADRINVTQGNEGAASASANYGSELVADWRLTLGPAPMALTVESGAAHAELDLGGIALKSLKMRAGTGDVKVTWAAPNPLAADMVDIEAAAGAISLVDVGRFGASHVRVHSGVGAISIVLGAVVDRDVALDLEATAGSIVVKVPPGIPAKAEAMKGSGVVTAEGWRKDAGDVFFLGAPGAIPRVAVKARTGAGSVTFAVGS